MVTSYNITNPVAATAVTTLFRQKDLEMIIDSEHVRATDRPTAEDTEDRRRNRVGR